MKLFIIFHFVVTVASMNGRNGPNLLLLIEYVCSGVGQMCAAHTLIAIDIKTDEND